MAFSFDDYFGIHQQALGVRTQRQVVLANNIAHSDTPNYKARDIDFREVLGAASGRGTELVRTHDAHLPAHGRADGAPGAKYRVPMQPSLDGNTVDQDVETNALADNAVRYQATLMFMNGKIKGLRRAITGSE